MVRYFLILHLRDIDTYGAGLSLVARENATTCRILFGSVGYPVLLLRPPPPADVLNWKAGV